MLKESGSKLEIRLYEQYSPECLILLGKVDIFASQFVHFMGEQRWFPLDPVTRTQSVPADSLARFLLVLRSSLFIGFSYLSSDATDSTASSQSEMGPIVPAPDLEQLAIRPPLPPRSNMLTDNSTNDGMQKKEEEAREGVMAMVEPLPLSGSPLLIPLSDQPPPPLPVRGGFHPHVRPPASTTTSPSILGKLSKLFIGPTSSSAHSHLGTSTHSTPSSTSLSPFSGLTDPWFHEIYGSAHNHFPQMFALYHAFRTHGYSNVASELPYLSKFVYLYVPGLYSGRNPFSNRAATTSNNNAAAGEGKITKHQSRVNELKSLGFDARMVLVPNDGTVYSNARLISEAVQKTHEETGKHIVLIGYSKGGVDSAAAMSMTPAIVPMIRCFITLFSPLHGSHVATDIEDSVLRPVVYLGIKNLLDADTAAMKDLSMAARSNFIFAYPFNDQVPSLSLAAAVASFAKASSFSTPYKYILSNYGKENDGLVACQDAIYPGSEVILISGMDHTGPRPEHPIFRDHVSFILAVIQTALNTTKSKWALDDETETTAFESIILPPQHVPTPAAYDPGDFVEESNVNETNGAEISISTHQEDEAIHQTEHEDAPSIPNQDRE